MSTREELIKARLGLLALPVQTARLGRLVDVPYLLTLCRGLRSTSSSHHYSCKESPATYGAGLSAT
jgi:hypothetical protein